MSLPEPLRRRLSSFSRTVFTDSHRTGPRYPDDRSGKAQRLAGRRASNKNGGGRGWGGGSFPDMNMAAAPTVTWRPVGRGLALAAMSARAGEGLCPTQRGVLGWPPVPAPAEVPPQSPVALPQLQGKSPGQGRGVAPAARVPAPR